MLTQDSYKVKALRLQLAIVSSGEASQATSIIEAAIATGKPEIMIPEIRLADSLQSPQWLQKVHVESSYLYGHGTTLR